MKITTLIPLADNEGKPFPESRIDSILRSLATQFSGCSTDGKVKGHSIHSGVVHQDESLRVTIICGKERLSEIRERIIEIGRELGQLSMYFEVRDDEAVQFLSTD